MGKIDMAFDEARLSFVSRACDILRDFEHRKVQDILSTYLQIETIKGKDAEELKSINAELDRHIKFWDIGMGMSAVLDKEREDRLKPKKVI